MRYKLSEDDDDSDWEDGAVFVESVDSDSEEEDNENENVEEDDKDHEVEPTIDMFPQLEIHDRDNTETQNGSAGPETDATTATTFDTSPTSDPSRATSQTASAGQTASPSQTSSNFAPTTDSAAPRKTSVRAAKRPPPLPPQKESSPGLWKLAGRKIKQNSPIGKYLLNSAQKTIKASQKFLGLTNMGKVVIMLPETKVYKPHEVLRGHVHLFLKEPLEAHSLYVELRGLQETLVREEKEETYKETEVVYEVRYEISGHQKYPTRASYPFELIIPSLRGPKMSSATQKTFVGSLVSSVKTIEAGMQAPIKWYLVCTLDVPGTLFGLQSQHVIHVEEEEF